MPTPQELEKQRKALEAQLMGGLAPGGTYTDPYGIPKVYSPTYYLQSPVASQAVGMKGMKDKSSLVGELVDVRIQQEKIERFMSGQPMSSDEIAQRKAELRNQIEIDYLGKPITAQENFTDTYQERTPATTFLEFQGGPGLPFVDTPIPTIAEPAPPLNRPPATQTPSIFQDPLGYVGTEASLLYSALRPQSLAPEETVQRQKEKAVKTYNPDIFDWDNVARYMAEQNGIDIEQAKLHTTPMREAYRLAAASMRDQLQDGQEDPTPEEVFDYLSKQVADIQNAPSITEQDPRFAKYGAWDPYVQYANRQVYGRDDGGVPDLNDVQMAYVKKQIDIMHDRFKAEELPKLKTELVPYTRLTVGSAGQAIDLPTELVDYLASTNPNTTKPILPSVIFGQDTEEIIRTASGMIGSRTDLAPQVIQDNEYGHLRSAIGHIRAINKFGDPNAWYLDKSLKQAIMNDPEAYRYDGFFTDMSYSGAVAETNPLWGIRVVFSPLNAVAGGFQNYFLEPVLDIAIDGKDGKSLTEAKRDVIAEESPLYADHPILANMAMGKGFAGEMDDLADATGVDGWGKTGMVMTGFAMDILDPTLGVMAAGSKGVRVSNELTKANKLLMAGKSAEEIKTIARGAAMDEFLNDFNGISAGYKLWRKGTGKGPRPNIYNGDLRLHFADDVQRQMEIRSQIDEMTKQNMPTHQIKAKLIEDGVDFENGIAKLWNDELDNAVRNTDNYEDAAKVANENFKAKLANDAYLGPLVKGYDEVDTVFKELGVAARSTPETLTLDMAPSWSRLSPKTRQYVEEILLAKTGSPNPVGADLLMGFDDIAATAKGTILRGWLFESLPNVRVGDEIVAITRRTWGNAETRDKLIAASNRTPLGEALADAAPATNKDIALRPVENIVGGDSVRGYNKLVLRSGVEVVPVARVGKNQLDYLLETMEPYNVPQRLYNRILAAAQEAEVNGSGYVALQDLRTLKEMNIDSVARLMPKEMIDIDDISKLTKKEQFRMLEAETQRRLGYAGEWWEGSVGKFIDSGKKYWQKSIFEPSEATAASTLGQKRMFQEISNEASTMDLQLRRTIDVLLENSEQGRQFRQFYGLDPDVPLTREQALGAAIVGPRTDELSLYVPDGQGGWRQVAAEEFITEDAALKVQNQKNAVNRMNANQQLIDDGKVRMEDGSTVSKKQIQDEYDAEVKTLKENFRASPEGIKLYDDIKKLNNELNKQVARERKALQDALKDQQKTGVGNPTQMVQQSEDLVKSLQSSAQQRRSLLVSNAQKEVQKKLSDAAATKQRRMDDFDARTEKLQKQNKVLQSAIQEKRIGGIEGNYIGAKETTDTAGNVTLDRTNWSSMNQAVRLQDNSAWMLSRIIFETKEKPTFWDRLSGRQHFYKTSIFNEAGQAQVEAITQAFALRAMEQPQKYWEFFEQAVREYDALSRDPTMLSVTVDPKKIVRNTGRDANGVYQLTDIRKNQAELTLGMYYNIEGSRIVDRHLLRAIDDDILRTGILGQEKTQILGEAYTALGGRRKLQKPTHLDGTPLTPSELDSLEASWQAQFNATIRQADSMYTSGIRSYVQGTMNKVPLSPRDMVNPYNELDILMHNANPTRQTAGLIGTPYESLFFTKNPDGTYKLLPPEALNEATFNGKWKTISQQYRQVAKQVMDLEDAGLPVPDALREQFDLYNQGAKILDNRMKIVRQMMEQGDAVLKKNGLYNRPPMTADDIDVMLNGLFGAKNEKVGIAILGEDNFRMLKNQLFNNRRTQVQNKIDAIFREELAGQRGMVAAQSFLNGLASAFYMLVLGGRAKFYVNNYLTAAPIVYTQTDMPAGELMKTFFGSGILGDARKIAYTNPSKPTYYQIAYRDPKSGVVYTYGELNEIILRGGSRSEASFVTANTGDDMVAWVSEKKLLNGESIAWMQAKLRRGAVGVSEIATKEDYIWRSAAMLDQLKKGRSIEEAQATARRSMYDYNDMTATEKAIAGTFLVFYSFNRQNLVGYLRSMKDIKNFKKYVNLYKFDRGIEMVLEESQISMQGEDGKWKPDLMMPAYAVNRTVLYKEDVKDKPGQEFYFGTPAIPGLDAIILANQMIQEPMTAVQEQLGNMAIPYVKLATGMESKFEKATPKRVPDDLIRVLADKNFFDGDSPNEIAEELSMFVGSPVTPIASDMGYKGYIYPLTEAQGRVFKERMKYLNNVPLLAPAQDWAAIFQEGPYDSFFGGTVGTADETANILERTLLTPMRTPTQQQQEIYDLYLRKQAIEEQIKQEEKRLKGAKAKKKEYVKSKNAEQQGDESE